MTRYVTSLFADSPADGYTYTGGGPAATPGDPMAGWLIIAGVVAVVVFFAWVVAKIGDLDSTSDKT